MDDRFCPHCGGERFPGPCCLRAGDPRPCARCGGPADIRSDGPSASTDALCAFCQDAALVESHERRVP